MKSKGLSISLRNLVFFDAVEDDLEKQAKAMGLRLWSFDQVMKEGEKMDAAEHPFRETKPDDVYILSYTSGTTGDSKGVKLAHRNIISSIIGMTEYLDFRNDDVLISYLPYPHSFEQALTCNALI
jgi:long-chain acyl-CoA synthetase